MIMPTRPSAEKGMQSEYGSSEVLSRRALNRALLERQLLARRASMSAAQAVEHLVGMQAQVPNSPYVGLWTRLQDFHPDHLASLILDRQAVRVALMRSTVHLVTADDCLALRPVLHEFLERNLISSAWGRNLAGMDFAAVATAAKELLDERPRTIAVLGKLLQERWPDRDALSLGYAVRNLLPLVQTPPRGIWGKGGLPVCANAETWLGRPLATNTVPDTMIVRYLKAFGPATVGDIQAWSGLKGLRATVDQLRPGLRVFRDERGRELFDVPGAPLPDPDPAMPPRFLPEYDNVLVAYAERGRVIPDEHLKLVITSLGHPPVLVDGFVRAHWQIKRHGASATLVIEAFDALTPHDRDALAEEGARLLHFAAGGMAHDIQFMPAD
jgi:hypothetical protein